MNFAYYYNDDKPQYCFIYLRVWLTEKQISYIFVYEYYMFSKVDLCKSFYILPLKVLFPRGTCQWRNDYD